MHPATETPFLVQNARLDYIINPTDKTSQHPYDHCSKRQKENIIALSLSQRPCNNETYDIKRDAFCYICSLAVHRTSKIKRMPVLLHISGDFFNLIYIPALGLHFKLPLPWDFVCRAYTSKSHVHENTNSKAVYVG